MHRVVQIGGEPPALDYPERHVGQRTGRVERRAVDLPAAVIIAAATGEPEFASHRAGSGDQWRHRGEPVRHPGLVERRASHDEPHHLPGGPGPQQVYQVHRGAHRDRSEVHHDVEPLASISPVWLGRRSMPHAPAQPGTRSRPRRAQRWPRSRRPAGCAVRVRGCNRRRTGTPARRTAPRGPGPAGCPTSRRCTKPS